MKSFRVTLIVAQALLATVLSARADTQQVSGTDAPVLRSHATMIARHP
jgi:hypothetical protein